MENMLSGALRVIRGLLNQLLINLEGVKGAEWLIELKKFLRGEKCWVHSALEFAGTVDLAEMTAEFWAKHDFFADAFGKVRLKKAEAGDNFKQWFFDLTEQPAPNKPLGYYDLLEQTLDISIMHETGSSELSLLYQFYSLLKKQESGKSGELLNDGHWNIFFIRDKSFVVRTVTCRWVKNFGWQIHAWHFIGAKWGKRCRAFSPKEIENKKQ